MQDITHQNFEADLVNASLAQPVLLDIWAPWCGPCKTLGPMLEKLETDYAGRFKLVKLNADDEPEIAQQLSQMFGVRSIPFCVLFKGGQPVDGFVGALPEAEVRKFLDKHVPSADEQAAEDAARTRPRSCSPKATPTTALDRLQAALATNPANDAARYDYLRAAAQPPAASPRRARPSTRSPPRPRARRAPGRCRPLARGAGSRADGAHRRTALAAAHRRQQARLRRPLRAGAAPLRHAANSPQAMDELLEIVMRDKAWNDELARKNYVAILELMGKPRRRQGRGRRGAEAGHARGRRQDGAAPADPVVEPTGASSSMALF